MSKALVTGASGFLGHHLVALVRRRGVKVRAFVRPSSATAHLEGHGVELVYGDAHAPLPDAFEGVDLLFHTAAFLTAGAPFGAGDPDSRYQTVNVDFTARLLAAAQAAGVRRFVFVSSNSVYDPQAMTPTPESARLRPVSPYGRSKVAAEERVRAYQAQGLATTIVRPAVIYGPGDRYFTPAALSLAQLPLLPLLRDGRALFDIIYVRDVAQLLWEAAQNPEAAGRIYNAGPGEPMTLRDLIAAYRRLTGRGPHVVDMSPALARRSAFLARPLLARLAPGAESALTPAGINLMQGNYHLDMTRAAQELGFRPRFTLEEGLARTLQIDG